MTKLLPEERTGVQEPRVRTGPEYADSLGDEAIDLAAMAGLWLDPWQQLAVYDICGVDHEDKWVALENGLLVARQNGKGGIIEALELAGLFLWGERLIVHSAHEFKTAQEAFRRVKDLIDGCGDLSRKVKKIATSHGEEGVELMDGRRLRFLARSKSSGRGFTGDRMIFDESQELPSLAIRAMLPTLAARPNPSVLYTGTVPGVENDAEHWTKIRNRGRAGNDATLTWLEWSIGEDALEDTDLDDIEGTLQANPAIGYRLSLKFTAAERATMDDLGYAQERLSLWPQSKTSSVIEKGEWGANVDPLSQMVGPIALGVHVGPSGNLSSISAAGWRSDGLPHIEVVDRRPGTEWLVEGLVFLAKRWDVLGIALDGHSPSAGVVTDLQAAGLDIIKMSLEDMLQATLSLTAKVKSGGLRHIGQKHLTGAATTATKRKVGTQGGWLFSAPQNVDITPLVASLIALHILGRADVKPEPVPQIRVLRR